MASGSAALQLPDQSSQMVAVPALAPGTINAMEPRFLAMLEEAGVEN